jgi:hypothetical protein
MPNRKRESRTLDPSFYDTATDPVEIYVPLITALETCNTLLEAVAS